MSRRFPKRWPRIGRPLTQRMALIKQMATSLVKHERITVPLPRAKSLARVADRLITLGKRDTVVSRLKVKKFMKEKEMAWKVWDILAPRYKFRNGGYTRVIRTKRRLGDAAPMAYVEFVDREGELRKASECNEETYAGESAVYYDTNQMLKAFKKEQKTRLDKWKVEYVKNPYQFDKEGKPLV